MVVVMLRRRLIQTTATWSWTMLEVKRTAFGGISLSFWASFAFSDYWRFTYSNPRHESSIDEVEWSFIGGFGSAHELSQ